MSEILTQALQELIDFIKNVSPALWEILVRQVYNDAVTYIVTAIIFAIVSIAFYKISKKRLAKDDMDMLGIFMAIGCVFTTIFTPVFFVTSLRMFINPNYYAITTIIKVLTGK